MCCPSKPSRNLQITSSMLAESAYKNILILRTRIRISLLMLLVSVHSRRDYLKHVYITLCSTKSCMAKHISRIYLEK